MSLYQKKTTCIRFYLADTLKWLVECMTLKVIKADRKRKYAHMRVQVFCFQYYLNEIALLVILGSDFRACSNSPEHRGGRHDDHDVSRERNDVTQTMSQSKQSASKEYECNMKNISHLLNY